MQRFACASCGAERVFDPASGKLRCTGCGSLESVAGAGDVAEHDLASALQRASANAAGQFSATAMQVTCGGCGATVSFEPPQVAGQCPFCGVKLVMQPKLADPLIAPGAILPFALQQERANQAVREWIHSRWFAPGELRQLALVQGLSGVYVPFWSFSASVSTAYSGERGDNYTETVTRQQGGQTVTEQVTRTRWSGSGGQVTVEFADLLVPATRAVQSIQLNDLEPWDLNQLTPYEPAYLAGFQAQRYTVPLADGFTLAKELMEPGIDAAIRQDIGGDQQRIHERRTRYRDTGFRHVLLPIWIGAYHFQGKLFQVMVNARTGEVQGDRPYSSTKIALAVLLAVALAAVVWWLAQRQG